jgi:hypothetical protein
MEYRMKIEQEYLSYLENVVNTAQLLGIDSVILDQTRISGIDDSDSVLLLHTDNIPKFSFGSIGLNRIKLFISRYSIGKSVSNTEVQAVVETTNNVQYVRSLTISGKGTKIDYRCANPATIRAPKSFNDTIKFKAKMSPEAVLYMQKGAGAMEADEVQLIGTKNSLSFEMADINGDKLTFKFGDAVELVNVATPSDINFSHKYPIKILQTLFKPNSEADFYVTTKGMLKVTINELDVYVLPRT